MNWNSVCQFSPLMALIGVLIGITSLTIGLEFYRGAQITIPIIIIFLLIYCLHVIVKFVKLIRILSVKKEMNQLHSKLHSIKRTEYSDFHESYIEVCNDIKLIFDKLTSKNCAVNIKVLIDGEGGLKMFTLARDEYSILEGKRKYERGSKSRWLALNSDMEKIHEDLEVLSKLKGETLIKNTLKECYYLKNSLPSESRFRHPLLKELGYVKRDDESLWYRIFRSKKYKWPLCYSSIITVPVAPILPRNLEHFSYNNYPRFIVSVDSESPKTFDKERDLDTFKGIADSIYYSLKDVEDEFWHRHLYS